MDYKHPVDYETFYFSEILDRIIQKGRQSLSAEQLSDLTTFLDYVRAADHPRDGVEKLARITGTSDIAIFFADILDNLPQQDPEDSVKRIDDHAGDFLAMFTELSQDARWKKDVFDQMAGAPVEEEMEAEEPVGASEESVGETLPFREYVHREIVQTLEDFFASREDDVRTAGEQLINRLTPEAEFLDSLRDYRDVPGFTPLVETFESLLEFPQDKEGVEEYLTRFAHRLRELTRHLTQVLRGQPESFNAFCSGEAAKVEEPAEELDKLVESAQELDLKKTAAAPLSEEDRQLRLLLREYIIHEIQELARELHRALQQYNQAPDSEEAVEPILSVTKILKDLGQIHKYPGIEQVASDLQKVLKKYTETQMPFSGEAIQHLSEIDKLFIQYIDRVLAEKDKEALEQLELAYREMLTHLKPAEKPLFALEAPETHSAFQEVNSHFIQRLQSLFARWYDNPEDEALNIPIDTVLTHLKNWYQFFRLDIPGRMLQTLHEMLTSRSGRKRLQENRSAVDKILLNLQTRLFALAPEDEELLEELKAEKVEEIPGVGVSDSLEAFQEVTLRQLDQLIQALEQEEMDLTDFVENSYEPVLEQISENSLLIGNDDLQLITNYFLTRSDLLKSLSGDKLPELKHGLSELFRELKEKIRQLPDQMPVNKMTREYDIFFEKMMAVPEEAAEEMAEPPKAVEETAEPEKVVEETPPTREQFIDEELTNVFRTEAKRYLENISEKLDELEATPGDRQIISTLGNLIHTLKGSAQMLNQTEVAEVARPLEEVIDRILDDELHYTDKFLPLYREAVSLMENWLKGETVDIPGIRQKIEQYVETSRVGAPAPEVPEEIATEEKAPEFVEKAVEPEAPVSEEMVEEVAGEEGDLLELSEKDPELLDIFRSEVGRNLDEFDKNLALIEKFRYDKKTVQTLDQAVHEVRAAAKMLGFSEVGTLLDLLEQVIEELSKKEKKYWDEAIPALHKSVGVVRELSAHMKVARNRYQEALEELEKVLLDLRKPEAVPEEEETPTEKEVVEEEVLVEQAEEEAPQPSRAVLEAFIQESRELLEDINFLLMKIEKDPENEEFTYHLMRSLHTLKGSAAMVDLDRIEKITHLAEDLVEGFRNRGEVISQKAVDVLFEVVDEVEFQVDALASGMKEKTRNYQEVLEKLEAFFQKKVEKAPEVVEKEAEPEAVLREAEDKLLKVEVRKEEEPEKPIARDTYVRLHVEQMDKLLNEAAELVINHTQLKTQLDRFKAYLPRLDMEGKNVQNVLWYLDKVKKDEERLLEVFQSHKLEIPGLEESYVQQLENLNRAINSLRIFYNNFIQNLQGIKELTTTFEEQIHKISRLSSSIHDEVMEARLVPIAMLFQRFHRPLRDLARKSGKKLKLVLEGESTELDRVLIEDLYEPMLHILRNAVDHGIEPVEERKKSGKPEEGTIYLRASHDRNFVTIEVEDDGQGVDLDKVREKAIKLGYLDADKAGELSDQELLEFLMYPGFSTREEATTVSGRGVGLDVVRNQIQKVKGDLRIFSEKGKGTRFIIRVPISLTVTQAMLVEVAGHIYAIPLLQAEETINIEVRDLELRDNSYFMRYRGGSIPVLNLANLLQIRSGKRKPISVVGEYPAIIVQDEGNRVALLVDRIVHREEILIKSLGPSLQRVRFITGGSVLADGKVVLVLDIPQIVKEAVKMRESGAVLTPEDLTTPPETAPATTTRRKKRVRRVRGRKPSILVVDDSLSIRKFLASLLTQRGFDVEMAKNGYNALEKLNQQDFDVLITDLEMPHLSGYELIEQVRDEDRWKEMPIIVLTGRASKHIQQLTRSLGADEFIVKPFKEDELMELLNEYIILED